MSEGLMRADVDRVNEFLGDDVAGVTVDFVQPREALAEEERTSVFDRLGEVAGVTNNSSTQNAYDNHKVNIVDTLASTQDEDRIYKNT